METKDSRPSCDGAATVAVVLFVLVLLAVGYVASLGPAVWLISRGFIDAGPGTTVGVVYAPLHYGADHSPFISKALESYGGLFCLHSPETIVQ